MHPKLNFARSLCISQVRTPAFPPKCSFAITYRCNMRCTMCNIWKKSHSRQEVLVDDVDWFFRKAPFFSWVGLTGGEPFLRPDLEEIVDVVTRHSRVLAALHFATNGFLHDTIIRTLERRLRKRPPYLFVVIVSIDGDPALHDAIRGVPGSWDRAMQTFCALKTFPGVKAQLGFTICSQNLGRFAEMFEAAKGRYPALRFDDLNVNVFQKSGFYYENTEMEAPDPQVLLAQLREILELDHDSFSINNFLRRTYLSLYPAFLKKKRTPVQCQALSSTVFVDPYGDMYPCAIFKQKLGAIHDFDQPLKKVWKSPRAREIRKKCKANACPVCWTPCDAFSAIASSLAQSVRAYAERRS